MRISSLRLLMVAVVSGLCVQNVFPQSKSPKIQRTNRLLFAESVDFSLVPDAAPAFVRGEAVMFKDSTQSVRVKLKRLLQEQKDEIGFTHYGSRPLIIFQLKMVY